MELREETVDSQVVYRGVIVNVRLDTARLVNGRLARREVVEHPGGVAVLPLHEDGTVSVVRQFRYPFMQVVTELPAGKLERGEDPRLAALRELEEEVGLQTGEMIDLGVLYTSPGFSSEVLHMYLARDLRQVDAHPDEDEFLQGERVPLADLLEQVMDGTIVDAKTVALVLKAARFLQMQ
jgi:ADP-ribose pyrophosphatase